jgi:hypothetical protein
MTRRILVTLVDDLVPLLPWLLVVGLVWAAVIAPA